MGFLLAFILLIVCVMACKLFYRWKTTIYYISLGVWLIPPSVYFGRLHRDVLTGYTTSVLGGTNACCKEYQQLNRHLLAIGYKPLLKEVKIPEGMSRNDFDFMLYIDFKMINELVEDKNFLYYLGCELDFIRRYMSTGRGMNVTEEEFRVLMAEFFLSAINDKFNTPRIFSAYTRFYRDMELVNKNIGWQKSIRANFDPATTVELLNTMVKVERVFKKLTMEDRYVACMYASVFGGWEKTI